MADIIGIGAINIDYILDARRVDSLDYNEAQLRLAKFEHGIERRASEQDIRHALDYLANAGPSVSPGGSALNVVASIASTACPLSVGYIGVHGQGSRDGFNFADWFSVLGIDRTFVRQTNSATGICVSYTKGAERSMLTWGGANDSLEEHLRNNYDQLITYLASARILHLTALASNREPQVLAQLIRDVKDRHPAVTISIDPGALWAPLDRSQSVNQLLGLADVIFANSAEFDQLTRRMPRMSDREAAGHCFRSLPALRSLLILKRYDLVKVFFPLGEDVIERTYQNRRIVDISAVVDDTGAGDAFAAGFLIGMALPGLGTSDGVELGLRFARRKLGFVGMNGASQYRQAFLSMSAEMLGRSRAEEHESHQKRVFIGHGRDAQWLHVKDCVVGWGLRPTYYESTSPTGKFTSEILADQALAADFAVIVATGDDTDSSGRRRGRQNVIHEIGLMQGRLGWGKVAILLEEGVEPFTNIAGLQHIPFSQGKVRQAFHELEAMLVREGLIHPPAATIVE